MNTESVDAISRLLKDLAEKDPNAKALFDYLGTYENDMRKTYVHSLARGTSLSEYKVREVLKQLEQEPFEIGELRIGRRGHRTRFEWDAPLTTVAAAALGRREVPDNEIAGTNWVADAGDQDDYETDTIDTNKRTHRFHLRRDFEASLVLPADLTAKEVERMCSFLKTLLVD